MHIAASQPPMLASLQRLLTAGLQRQASGTPLSEIVEPVVPAPPAGALAQTGTSVQMLVAIAASNPDAIRRRASAAADKGLGALEHLERRLRLGQPVDDAMHEMADWAGSHDVPDDAAGAQLVREIELRVLVEIARHGRAR